jgi:inner membrane protein
VLFGANLSRAGLNRKTGLATLTMAIAAEFPDIDVAWNLAGKVPGFEHHRGFTHTFLGAPVVAAVVVALVWAVHRWRLKRGRTQNLPVRWPVLYVLALIASLSHILLDFTNNYGVRPLMPINYRWYSWDIVFIFEPILFLFLVFGLVGPLFTKLIAGEIGEERRRGRLPGRAAAIIALILTCALWWFRDAQHRRAIVAMQAQTYKDEEPLRAAAYPYWVDPFTWHGVVETRNSLDTVPVNSFFRAVDPQELGDYRPKPEETPLSLAAKESRLGRAFLDWARFPYVEAEPQNDGSVWFRFRDLRFAYPERPNVLQVWVHVSKQGTVLQEVVGPREAD